MRNYVIISAFARPGLFFVLLLFEDFDSHVVDGGVVKNNDASVRSRLNVYTAVFAKFVVAAAEVVSDGLDGYVELVGNLMSRAVGQTVFEAAEVVE